MKSWFSKLKEGLQKTSTQLSTGITKIFTHKKLDHQTLEELEELLISADMGVETSALLTKNLSKSKFDKEVTDEEVRQALAENIREILEPYATPLDITPVQKPFVILVAGVNGSGKTTTIGKMAKHYKEQGKSVRLVAADTFRAAAVEQLKVWGTRVKVPVEARETGTDAAGLCYDALEKARTHGDDILIIDTAGRLQNKVDLMGEIAKINRVIKKLDPEAPHAALLVLDATTGQNAHSQVEIFSQMVGITGLVITKLDGTAKGGVVVSLANKFKKPIHLIGVGESIDDLKPFKADDFANSLMGLTP